VRDGVLEQLDGPEQLGVLGGDDEGAAVVVADGGHTAGAQHASQLDQRGDGIAEVDQHGVGVDGVEARVVERQLVQRAGVELGVVQRPLGGRAARHLDLPGVGVESRDAARRDRRREVERDAADAAAGVEHVHARPEMRQQERDERARVAAGDVAVLDALVDDVALIHALSRGRGRSANRGGRAMAAVHSRRS
jgi:hypothetical protein